MHHAQRHAQTRIRERRRRVALEAARLMAESGIRDFHQAKLKAAQRLGILDDPSLPRNREIAEALDEHQRLFSAEKISDQALYQRRRAAQEAMRFLQAFEPRLVGGTATGMADPEPAVSLHLFADNPEHIGLFLEERGIPASQQLRRIRLSAKHSTDAPAWLFSADDVPFELIGLPREALRQSPPDPVDGRPMQRLSLGALEALLLESELSSYESINDGADIGL